MITYRTFRNADPPHVRDLWNRNLKTRGFGKPSGCDQLEQALFSKPYFDREGLILAWDGKRLVGLCHAGFGCDESESRLDRNSGTICMLLVDESYRRRGIGTELLRRGQEYLQRGGSSVQYAGPLHPLNAFYLGLYGGSDLPGVLESNAGAIEFLSKRGYRDIDRCIVLQRSLDLVPAPTDTRLPLLRRGVEITVEPWPRLPSWWRACLMGQVIMLGYEMVDRASKERVGHAFVWEMENFERAWGLISVGIIELEISEPRRRQGYGKLLLHTMMKHLQEQRVKQIEVQTMQRNVAALRLYQSLGFTQVDVGHAYRYDAPTAQSVVSHARQPASEEQPSDANWETIDGFDTLGGDPRSRPRRPRNDDEFDTIG